MVGIEQDRPEREPERGGNLVRRRLFRRKGRAVKTDEGVFDGNAAGVLAPVLWSEDGQGESTAVVWREREQTGGVEVSLTTLPPTEPLPERPNKLDSGCVVEPFERV